MKRTPWWLLLAVLASCGPNPKAPVQVMAIVPTVQGNYETRQIELTTVGNITSFTGSLFNYVGGTRVVMDPNDPLQNVGGGLPAMDDAKRYEVLLKDKGMDVRGNFIERSGVLWPADFHTWNMVSTYYNLERSFLYWQDLYDGKPTTEIENNRVLYWSTVKLNGAEVKDNALYLSFVKSFVIVPFDLQQRVPLSMNLGVMAHEFSHRVYNTKVLEGAGIHAALLSWNGPAFNLFKSLDEGLADFHGFGATCKDSTDGPGCRPNYLAVSLSDEATVRMRDVSRTDACMDANTRNAYLNFSPDQWVRDESMYRVGNLFAAALYQAGNNPSSGSKAMEVLQKAVLAAYDDDASATPGLNQLINNNLNTPNAFTLESVSNVLVAHAPTPALQKNLCNELVDRLQLNCPTFPCAQLPACPSTSSRGTTSCQTLPPP